MPSLRICFVTSGMASSRRLLLRSGAHLPLQRWRGARLTPISIMMGRLTLLVMTNGGAPHLYLNQGGTNQSLRIKLVGTKSNRDGIGAVVRVSAGADKQWLTMKTGSSYLSQSELVLTFGMGAKTKAESVEIDWPSGQVDKLSNIAAGQTITVQEAKGPDCGAGVRGEVAQRSINLIRFDGVLNTVTWRSRHARAA